VVQSPVNSDEADDDEVSGPSGVDIEPGHCQSATTPPAATSQQQTSSTDTVTFAQSIRIQYTNLTHNRGFI